MCVLLDAGWFSLHPTNWKQAGVAGVYCCEIRTLERAKFPENSYISLKWRTYVFLISRPQN